MIELSKRQERVYVLLRRHWQERGSQPNLRDLSKEMGIHYVSFKQHLDALAKEGYLELESQGRGKQPIIRMTPKNTGISLGGLVGSEEHLEGYINLPGRPACFALRVKGDSMSELIQGGDVVILEKAEAASGAVCAVRFEDETTLKHLYHVGEGKAELRPHDPEYAALSVRLDDVDVVGVFDALLRGSVAEDLLEAA